jgi:hypothetical protein
MRSSERSQRTGGGLGSIAAVLALVPLAADAAEEGKKVIFAMLLVGLVFISVIVIGELSHWLRHRR